MSVIRKNYYKNLYLKYGGAIISERQRNIVRFNCPSNIQKRRQDSFYSNKKLLDSCLEEIYDIFNDNILSKDLNSIYDEVKDKSIEIAIDELSKIFLLTPEERDFISKIAYEIKTSQKFPIFSQIRTFINTLLSRESRSNRLVRSLTSTTDYPETIFDDLIKMLDVTNHIAFIYSFSRIIYIIRIINRYFNITKIFSDQAGKIGFLLTDKLIKQN